jgi:hypothetical protein
MRQIVLIAAAAASLALAAGAARAEDPATTTDIRCLVVSAALSQSPDADAKRAGGLGLIYFWGRLEGRGATADVAGRLGDEALKMTPDDIKAEAPTCGATLTAATTALQAAGQKLGERLQQNAPAADQPPAPPPAAPPPS